MTTAASKAEYDKVRRPVYAERKRELRKKNYAREQETEALRLSKPENTAAYLYTHAKARAKRRGTEFSITHADIVIPETCPVLGIPLYRGGKHNPHSPSLDRVDNTKGYIPGNVMVVSLRANLLKKDATLTELMALVKYMKENVP